MKLDLVILTLLLIVLFFGNILDFFVTLPFRPLDLVMILILVRSLFLTQYRFKKADYFLLFLFLFNLSLLFVNSKFLLSYSSFLYLFRIGIYTFCYPFFIRLVKTKNYSNIFRKAIPIFLVFHLGFFILNSKLSLQGYDPHVGRLYGPFLDPNYYAILLVIILSFYLSNRKWSRGDLLTVTLTLVSLFLTYSRIGFVLVFILFLVQFLISKNLNYFSLFAGFLFISLTNFKYASRLLFAEGNLDSFILRIQSYLDGALIYSNNVVPLGFNNIKQSSLFLTSNLNMSSSYSDSLVLNLLLTGGVVNLFLFAFGIYFIGMCFAKTNMKIGVYTLIFIVLASFIQNVVFHPYFLVLLIALFSYSLSTKTKKDIPL